MISSFATAIGTALSTFITDMTSAVSTNAATVLPWVFGLVGIFVLIRIVLRLVNHR